MSESAGNVWTDIVSWVESSLLSWQSDAFNRIYLKRKLSQNDINQLGLLLRDHFNIRVELGDLKVKPFRLGSDNGGRPITSPPLLVSMGNLTNVNAISPDNTILFFDPEKPCPSKPQGLTIIYGLNGSGKSGYSRVLKRACYARDSYVHTADVGGNTPLSPILPNIHDENNLEAATAIFVWQIDGKKKNTEWRDGKRITDPDMLNLPTPPLAVFDADCARAYVNNDNEVIYRPYGLDILEELARVFDILKKDVVKDIETIKVQLEALKKKTDGTKLGTGVDKILLGKYSSDAAKKTKKFAESYSKDDRKNLKNLRSIFAEQDPKKKAKKLQDRAKRLAISGDEIHNFSRKIGDDDFLCRLRKAIESFAEAQENAAKIDEGGEFLHGTGEPLWETMFKAAEEFSKKNHSDSELSHNEECVLCQQPLGNDGRKMLARLRDLLQRGAVKTRDVRKKEMERQLKELEEMDLSPDRILHESFLAELKSIASESDSDPSGLEKRVKKFVKALADRRKQLLHAGKTLVWQSLAPFPPNPVEDIKKLCDWAEKRSADLVKDREQRASELKELEAKEAFASHYSNIEHLINLWECYKALDSTKITNTAKRLSEKAITKHLTNKILSEIGHLGHLAEEKVFFHRFSSTKGKA